MKKQKCVWWFIFQPSQLHSCQQKGGMGRTRTGPFPLKILPRSCTQYLIVTSMIRTWSHYSTVTKAEVWSPYFTLEQASVQVLGSCAVWTGLLWTFKAYHTLSVEIKLDPPIIFFFLFFGSKGPGFELRASCSHHFFGSKMIKFLFLFAAVTTLIHTVWMKYKSRFWSWN